MNGDDRRRAWEIGRREIGNVIEINSRFTRPSWSRELFPHQLLRSGAPPCKIRHRRSQIPKTVTIPLRIGYGLGLPLPWSSVNVALRIGYGLGLPLPWQLRRQRIRPQQEILILLVNFGQRLEQVCEILTTAGGEKTKKERVDSYSHRNSSTSSLNWVFPS